MALLKKILAVLAALALLAVFAVGGLWCWWRWHAPERILPEPDKTPVVQIVDRCLVDCLGGETNGVKAHKFDVRKLTCRAFERVLRREVPPKAHLWMSGESDWIATWREDGKNTRLADMMDVFSGLDNVEELEYVRFDSVLNLFACYVGEIERDILPAFAALKPDDLVVPELFYAKAIPELDWLDWEGLDEDVSKAARAEIRSMQIVRRVVLEGDIRSRKGEEGPAIAAWARARKRNPADPMLQDRLARLRKNAEVFLKIGKFGFAARCFEVIVAVDPYETEDAKQLAFCLKQVGKKKLAEKVLQHLRPPR